VLRRVGLVDREQRVARVETLAVEVNLDLAVLPLEQLVGPLLPDRHRPGAVGALPALAVERQGLERGGLGAARQAGVVGGRGQPVRDRRRRERAVVLEAEVPVQARGVVLLDDEARQLRLRAALALARRLGRRLEIALGLVLAELVGHANTLEPRDYPRTA